MLDVGQALSWVRQLPRTYPHGLGFLTTWCVGCKSEHLERDSQFHTIPIKIAAKKMINWILSKFNSLAL